NSASIRIKCRVKPTTDGIRVDILEGDDVVRTQSVNGTDTETLTFTLPANDDGYKVKATKITNDGENDNDDDTEDPSEDIQVTAEVSTGLVVDSAVNKGDYVVINKEELVTNGTFDIDTSGWTADTNGTKAQSNETLEWTVTDDGANRLQYQNMPALQGAKYTFSGSIQVLEANSTKRAVCNLYSSSDGSTRGSLICKYTTLLTDTWESFTLAGTSTDNYLLVEILVIDPDVADGKAGDKLYIDNISVQLANDKFKAIENADDGDSLALLTPITFDTDIKYKASEQVVDYNGQEYKCTQDMTEVDGTQDTTNIDYWTSAKSKFRKVDYISNQALAYHRYNPLTKVYDGIVTEVMMNDAYAKDSTTKIMTDNGFSSLGGGLFSKGDWWCLPVGYWQTLNRGIAHPMLNWLGTNYKTRADDTGAAIWYYSTDDYVELGALADCFNYAATNEYNGSITGGHNDSTAHPQSKFYDIVYSSQFTDLRHSAKAISYHDIASKEFSNGVSGKGGVCDTVGMISKTAYIQTGIRFDASSVLLNQNNTANPIIGDILNRNSAYIRVTVGSGYIELQRTESTIGLTDSSYNVLTNTSGIAMDSGWVVEGDSTFSYVKNLPITQSKEQFVTDIIGRPSDYNSSDADAIQGDGGTVDTNAKVWNDTEKLMYKALNDGVNVDDAVSGNADYSEVHTGYPTIMKDMLARGETIVGLNPALVNRDGSSALPTESGDGGNVHDLSAKCLVSHNEVYLSGNGNSTDWTSTYRADTGLVPNRYRSSLETVNMYEDALHLINYTASIPVATIQDPKAVEYVLE
ncbi:MAG: hypothetical protein DRN95_08135, partial [Candidatus Hydrothermarchaeota archaeon]